MKRNSDTQIRWIRLAIFNRDKHRCRWCGEVVRFNDTMVVGHGIAFADAPSLDHYDNWFTSCLDCNSVGRNSLPPKPIALEEVSAPELLSELQEIKAELVAQRKAAKAAAAEPAADARPVFNWDACQCFGQGCDRVGCQIPSCENYTHFAYSGGDGAVVSEYDPIKQEW